MYLLIKTLICLNIYIFIFYFIARAMLAQSKSKTLVNSVIAHLPSSIFKDDMIGQVLRGANIIISQDVKECSCYHVKASSLIRCLGEQLHVI